MWVEKNLDICVLYLIIFIKRIKRRIKTTKSDTQVMFLFRKVFLLNRHDNSSYRLGIIFYIKTISCKQFFIRSTRKIRIFILLTFLEFLCKTYTYLAFSESNNK